MLGKTIHLRKTDWLLIEELAVRLKLSAGETLMWVVRLGYPSTVSRYKQMMKKLEDKLK